MKKFEIKTAGKWFIADDTGAVWAHDIETEAEARAILSDLVSSIKEEGREIPEGLAVLCDE